MARDHVDGDGNTAEDGPPFAGRDPGGSDGPARVYPLLAEAGDRRLLAEWLRDLGGYEVVDPDRPVREASFDLCVVDAPSFERHLDALQERKRAAEPAILPYLLLVPEREGSPAELDGGRLVDGVVGETVDEILAMPIRKAELEWRLRALLRLRAQSLHLRARERRLRQFKRASEAAGHAVYITDADGRIEYANPAFEEITGYDREAVRGETPRILRSGETPDEYYDDLWATLKAGETWEEEIRNERADGTVYDAHQTITPIDGTDGDPEGYVAIQMDVTDRKERERELRELTQLLGTVIDASPLAIVALDGDGTVDLWNEAAEDLYGYGAAEVEGEEPPFVPEGERDRFRARVRYVLEGGRVDGAEVERRRADGSEITVRTWAEPIVDGDGTVTGLVAVEADVSERIRTEQRLAVLRRVLRHNIRNAVTVINGYADRLSGDLDAAAREAAAETVKEQTANLDRWTEEAQRLEGLLERDATRTPVDLSRLVERELDRLAAAHPDATVSADLPPRAVVLADDTVEEAVRLAVTNAVEHNDRPEPHVSVSVERPADGSRVELRVADDGPGIPAAERAVIERGDETPLEHSQGVGLWMLSIIVDRNGGDVAIEDNEPRGSVVTIRLPAADRADAEGGEVEGEAEAKSETEARADGEGEGEREGEREAENPTERQSGDGAEAGTPPAEE